MPTIEPIQLESCERSVRNLLDDVRDRLGMTPNLLLVMAKSPVVLEAFLALQNGLEAGVLPPKLREQIALAVAERDRSGYSSASHTAFGRATGLSEEEIDDARHGRSANSKVHAALRFACQVVERQGHVTEDDWTRLRAAGYSEREMLEITAWVCMTVFSDYFAEATQAAVDFPRLAELPRRDRSI